MAESFVAYIDESGCDGFKFRTDPQQTGGSSSWLILSAVVIRKSNDDLLGKIQRSVLEELNWKSPNRVIHFRKLSHERRVTLTRRLAKSPIRTVSVLVYKPVIKEPGSFAKGGRMYAYAVRLLLERISWLCRDEADGEGDGSVMLRFEHRRSTSYADLRSYLERLKLKASQGEDIRIDWSVIRPDQVRAHTKGSYFGLQAADAVAGSYYHGLEPNDSGWTESRYCTELAKVTYRRGNRALPYGAKLWPPEVAEWMATREELKWFLECYPR